MEIIIQRLLACLFVQLIVALCAYGFVFGFGAFLALTAGYVLLVWCYWRVVVGRPRVEVCGAFVGSFDGQSYYTEVLSW